MKPTVHSLDRRLSAIESHSKEAQEEPLVIRVQYVDHLGQEISPATEWTTYRDTTDTGRELIVEWPVYNGEAAVAFK